VGERAAMVGREEPCCIVAKADVHGRGEAATMDWLCAGHGLPAGPDRRHDAMEAMDWPGSAVVRSSGRGGAAR